VPVHTQIRLAHDPAHAILETLQERHIDLILMGWKGSTSTPGRIFGDIVDTVFRQAACEVILAKLQEPISFNHWLVPTAGGPNSQAALALLPALITLADPEELPNIRVCRVFEQRPVSTELEQFEQIVAQTAKQLNYTVAACPIWGAAIAEAVVKLAIAKHCDVIMLGASREGLLQQVIKGNVPEAITRDSLCSVILVRGAITASER
jgi:chloride channel protein, CIC family